MLMKANGKHSAGKTIAETNLKDLELSQKKGELVSLTEVNAYVASMIIRAREVLTRIGQELQDRLSTETDPVTIRALSDSDVNIFSIGRSDSHSTP